MSKLPVEGHPNLVRDENTGAVLNINSDEIKRAREAKNRRKQEQERLNRLEEDVSSIKSMLQQLIAEKHG